MSGPSKGEQYVEDYMVLGNYSAVARKHSVHESVVRRAVKDNMAKQHLDPRVARSMAAMNLQTVPRGGWIKSDKADEDGLKYSWYVNLTSEADQVDLLAEMESVFRSLPAVRLPAPTEKAAPGLLGFIPLNDLHSGMYAWADETGYGDWDLTLATKRLEKWVGCLVREMPACEECILFYNGDTLHANGNEPFTPASKHILDTDSRQFKVVDATAASIIATADLAAQKHKHVRLVIKRGNHDEDSHLALLMAAKYRYRDQKNVTVEEDPRPHWSFRWGKVLLLGHHGDRKKPVDLILKLLSDYRAEYGMSKYVYLWTAHLHQRALQVFHGVQWEQASCLTEPDAYGANWGSHAEAQAIIYDKERGECRRFSIRP